MPANSKPTMAKGEMAARWLLREGFYIRDLRLQAGLTQLELAQRVGMNAKQTISQIERGHAHVPPDRSHELARALGVSLYEFSKQLLSTQNPWLAVGLFGDRRLAREIRLAAREG